MANWWDDLQDSSQGGTAVQSAPESSPAPSGNWWEGLTDSSQQTPADTSPTPEATPAPAPSEPVEQPAPPDEPSDVAPEVAQHLQGLKEKSKAAADLQSEAQSNSHAIESNKYYLNDLRSIAEAHAQTVNELAAKAQKLKDAGDAEGYDKTVAELKQATTDAEGSAGRHATIAGSLGKYSDKLNEISQQYPTVAGEAQSHQAELDRISAEEPWKFAPKSFRDQVPAVIPQKQLDDAKAQIDQLPDGPEKDQLYAQHAEAVTQRAQVVADAKSAMQNGMTPKEYAGYKMAGLDLDRSQMTGGSITSSLPFRAAEKGGAALFGGLGNIVSTIAAEAGDKTVAEQRDLTRQYLKGWSVAQQRMSDQSSVPGDALVGDTLGMVAEFTGASALPGGAIAYIASKSTTEHLAEADEQGITGANKYVGAAVHGAIDGASIWAGTKLGAGLASLGVGGEAGNTLVGRAVQAATEKYGIGKPLSKIIELGGESGAQAALGIGMTTGNYLADVTLGRRKFNGQELSRQLISQLPRDLATGVIAGAVHQLTGAIGKRFDVLKNPGKVKELLRNYEETVAPSRVPVSDESTFIPGASFRAIASAPTEFPSSEQSPTEQQLGAKLDQMFPEKAAEQQPTAEQPPPPAVEPIPPLQAPEPAITEQRKEPIVNQPSVAPSAPVESSNLPDRPKGSSLQESLRAKNVAARQLDEQNGYTGRKSKPTDQSAREGESWLVNSIMRRPDWTGNDPSRISDWLRGGFGDSYYWKFLKESGQSLEDFIATKTRPQPPAEVSQAPDETPPQQPANVDSSPAPPAASNSPEEDTSFDFGANVPAERAPLLGREKQLVRTRLQRLEKNDALPDGLKDLDQHAIHDILSEADQRASADNEYISAVRDEYRQLIGNSMAARARLRERRGSDADKIPRFDQKVQALRDGEYPALAAEASSRGGGDLENGLFDIMQGGAKQFAEKRGDDYIDGVLGDYLESQKKLQSETPEVAGTEAEGPPARPSGEEGSSAPPQASGQEVAPFALSREASPDSAPVTEPYAVPDSQRLAPQSPAERQPNLEGMPTDMEKGTLAGQQGLFNQEHAPNEPAPGEPMQAAAMLVPPQLANAVNNITAAAAELPKFHDARKSTLAWSGRGQQNTQQVKEAAKSIRDAIPDKIRREAVTNWIQAGGDPVLLQQRATASTGRLKKGYEAALSLTPAEVKLAQGIQKTYKDTLDKARYFGFNINELPNYVNQLWKRQPFKNVVRGKKLSASIQFAKERYHDSFFHGEQAGLSPQTKDISALLPVYINEVNRAINDKLLVADLARGKASDGRSLLAPTGAVEAIDDPNTGERTYYVLPDMPAAKDTKDYKPLSQPALHDWRWKAADTEGNPIFVKGDLRVHPELAQRLKNILGQSALREWWSSPSENPLGDIPKTLAKFFVDDVQQTAKQTMLGFLSPFHQIQEGTHAVGHRVNPFFNLPKIDLNEPAQLDAASHGLMLLPDRVSEKEFMEGVGAGSKNLATAALGKLGKPGEMARGVIDGYQNYLFHQYIPALKLKTYDHVLERNQNRFKDELASGAVTSDQLKYLSAQQANAAYGHLNYADMARNPTMQHLAQGLLLAPDFLEARAKFVGQAAVGAISKTHAEQFAALGVLAIAQYTSARLLNKLLDDDLHLDHPFEVIVGNRRYRMRSVPEDLYMAMKDTRAFVYGRASPILSKSIIEGLSGVNWRKEPTSFGQTISDIIANTVPLSLQPFTRGLSETAKNSNVSPFEQLLGSLGLPVSRYSPTSKVYDLASSWIKQHGAEYGITPTNAVYPISKYQQLRYALEDDDQERAISEINSLVGSDSAPTRDLGTHFKQAINKPFTGSLHTDFVFKKSLSDEDKALFDAAKKRRQILLSRFYQAMKARREAAAK